MAKSIPLSARALCCLGLAAVLLFCLGAASHAVPLPESPETIAPPPPYTELWAHRPLRALTVEARALLPLPDGGVLVAGNTFSGNTTPPVAEIWRFDSKGALLWRKRPVHSVQSAFTHAALTADGQILLTGGTNFFSFDEGLAKAVLLVCLTPAGQIVWEKTYPAPSKADSLGSAVLAMPDNSILVAGYVGSKHTKGLVLRLRANGTVLSSQTIAPGQGTWVRSMIGSAVLDAPRKRVLLANNDFSQKSEHGQTTIVELPLKGHAKELARFDDYTANLHADPFNQDRFFLYGAVAADRKTRRTALLQLDQHLALRRSYNENLDGLWAVGFVRDSPKTMLVFATVPDRHPNPPALVRLADDGSVLHSTPISHPWLHEMAQGAEGTVFLAGSHYLDDAGWLWVAKWHRQPALP